ncbi:4-hydroxyphenylpyruvate dioxygenase-like isoform X2 [Sycon ciliatum]|uniref:4-hydroxyphenylpyruvate dioxygenase-like isoform X2 n=1 Tax=Sycon ciliatum TaxID=27933 RepID=UPI0031F6F682
MPKQGESEDIFRASPDSMSPGLVSSGDSSTLTTPVYERPLESEASAAAVEETDGGKVSQFDHITFWVGNAKQAATFYIARFGFQPLAYRGLENGSRDMVSHVVRAGQTIFMFQSALLPGNEEMGDHLRDHGDGVRDVAFTVDNCRAVFKRAVAKGATVIRQPQELEDSNGTVTLATVRTFGDTTHTFVERTNYTGEFLPSYTLLKPDPIQAFLPFIDIQVVDHVVCNQDWDQMESVAEWYERNLSFHRFWSGYDKETHTEFTSMHTVVLTNEAETIKLGITEPAVGRKKSQIEEYVTFYGGAGCQHIALKTPNIIESVSRLVERGTSFLPIPASYYASLRERLKNSKVKITENLDELERLNILVDFDDNGYLLQLFTSPMQDRPTVFLELIQRNNHSGFGAGNFKSLFQAIEEEQSRRGTL